MPPPLPEFYNQSHVIRFAKFDRNERDWLYSPLWLAGAEKTEVGQGTERRPGSRAFAGVTPELRHPPPKNQNTYQCAETRPGTYFSRW